jgi:hypothetical protein
MFWTYAFSMDTGAVVNYWQLVSLYVSIGNGQANAKARGFLSQEAFEAGKPPMLEQEITFPVLQLDQDGSLFAGVLMLAQSAQSQQYPIA